MYIRSLLANNSHVLNQMKVIGQCYIVHPAQYITNGTEYHELYVD
jgi:hypothetical protein